MEITEHRETRDAAVSSSLGGREALLGRFPFGPFHGVSDGGSYVQHLRFGSFLSIGVIGGLFFRAVWHFLVPTHLSAVQV